MKLRTSTSSCSKNYQKNGIIDSDGQARSKCHQSFKKIRNGRLNIQKKKMNEYQKIKEIPEIQLSKQQMQGDPIKLMSFLQQNYKEYGAIKLKACASWNSPFSLRYNEKPINTRVQKLHRLKQGKPFVERIEQHTILSFIQIAKEFQKNYKFKHQKLGSTQEACLQNQFWQNVNVSSNKHQLISKEKTVVEYAADLPVNRFGSGFPLFQTTKTTDQNFNYVENLFNLNNLYKSPSSIVKFSDLNHQKISGVTTPWVYMGMLFSVFCWHVQDLWLNSVNYNHMGSTKTWYIIPESDKQKFNNFILRTTGQRTFLQSITYMVDPLQLIKEGIKVYKAYQRPTQYILTFFNAYHCGFSQGFNVGEAVNMISVQSLPVIKSAIAYNQLNKKRKPPVLCYEWLIAGNIGDKDIDRQVIQKEYKKIVTLELQQLKKCLQKLKIMKLEIVDKHLKYDRMSCNECKYYHYLSILVCNSCNTRYCLQDVKKCCGKGFTFMSRPFDKQRKQTYEALDAALD